MSESVSDKRVVQIEIGECEKTKNTMENSISINIGGVIQLCRKIITRVTSKINSAAGFCVELRRLSTKKVTNVISGEL